MTTTRKGTQLEARLTGAQLRLLDDVFADLDATTEAHWRAAMVRLAETDR